MSGKKVGSLLSQTTVMLTAMGAVFFAMQSGCGEPRGDDDSGLPTGVQMVKGYAQFGVQCPYGSPDAPVPVKLEAVNCNLPVDQIELAEPLLPLVFQVDCQHKLLTVRGSYRSMKDDSWGILPDNSFDFVEDFGTARLVSDGHGGSNCEVPLQVDLWGTVSCSNSTDDKADISLEARWDPKTYPSPGPQPWVTPSPAWVTVPVPVMVMPTPTPEPTSSHRPDPFPAPAPHPSPSPSPSPSPLPLISPTPLPQPPADACNLPPNCYLYATTDVKQCE